jgi:hypothetical protein
MRMMILCFNIFVYSSKIGGGACRVNAGGGLMRKKKRAPIKGRVCLFFYRSLVAEMLKELAVW